MPLTSFPINTVDLADLERAEFPNYALRILAEGGHVNHNFFWLPGKKYYDFFWDAVVRPWDTVNTGYLVSAGYGGNHNLLWGFISDGTHFAVTGNIRDDPGAVNITFQTTSKFKLGDWHHLAVAWNRQHIVVYVNGVAEATTTFVADYRTVAGVGTGNLYVGGSNHSKFDMDVAWIRGFEGILPMNVDLSKPFRPHRYPSTTYASGEVYHAASFLADYTQPGRMIPDLSDGLSNGQEQVITNTVVAASGITSNGNARNIVTAIGMPNSPKTVTTAVTTGTHTTAALIAMAMRASLQADTDVNGFFHVGGSGADITLTARVPQANDSTMNLTIEDVTSAGITEDTTAVQTTPGYQGWKVKHSGVLEGLIGTSGAFIDSDALNDAGGDLPTWVVADITKPEAETEAAPSGSPLMYDNFARISVPFWDDSVSLGSTEGGMVGPQAWTGAASSYGTAANSAFYNGEGFGSPVFCDPGVTDVDVRFNQTNGLSAYLRYADANNYIFVQATGTALNIGKKLAGVDTSIYANAVEGVPPADIKVITDGNNIKVYYSGVLKADETETLPTGTKVGFLLTSYGLERMNQIVIYAA